MPQAIISSIPQRCIDAVNAVEQDFSHFIKKHHKKLQNITLIGLSIGNFPATYLANKFATRLISIASGDAGDLLIWQSPAAISIKQKAIKKGYNQSDYSCALSTYNPINNLNNIRKSSIFVLPADDIYIPAARRNSLLKAARKHGFKTHTPSCGHVIGLMRAYKYLKDRQK